MGQRLKAHAPFGHWKTQTLIAGLRIDGLTAPWVLDGPMNRLAFEVYVETQLAPELKKGDVVIRDNLSSHKSPKAKQAIKHRGAWLLFLPPYSPDLNPIEMAFAKLIFGAELFAPLKASGAQSATSLASTRPRNAKAPSKPPDRFTLEHPPL